MKKKRGIKQKKRLKGVVVSDKMQKTAVVLVNRYVKHRLLRKYVKRGKKYKAHNKDNQYKVGDRVIIEECRPLSKDKTFRIIAKL
jgi:small subunit ribosomal protein S17